MSHKIVTGESGTLLLAVVEFFENAGVKLHLVKQRTLTPAQLKERDELVTMLKAKGFTFKEKEEI
jgi:hypothetical protein